MARDVLAKLFTTMSSEYTLKFVESKRFWEKGQTSFRQNHRILTQGHDEETKMSKR